MWQKGQQEQLMGNERTSQGTGQRRGGGLCGEAVWVLIAKRPKS